MDKTIQAPEGIRIAIDGPGGAGKSTVAKAVAGALGFDYIDTGAMYRAVGYKILSQGIDLVDRKAIDAMLERTDIDFSHGHVLLDGIVVDDRIRTAEVSRMASDCSALPEVRAKLVALQQKMGAAKSVVMDGRDIGTNVLPNAEYKFFLTASPEERARRRTAELLEKGMPAVLEDVFREIQLRDHQDTNRALNPLRQAPDARLVDTTGLSVEESVRLILSMIDIPEKTPDTP